MFSENSDDLSVNAPGPLNFPGIEPILKFVETDIMDEEDRKNTKPIDFILKRMDKNVTMECNEDDECITESTYEDDVRGFHARYIVGHDEYGPLFHIFMAKQTINSSEPPKHSPPSYESEKMEPKLLLSEVDEFVSKSGATKMLITETHLLTVEASKDPYTDNRVMGSSTGCVVPPSIDSNNSETGHHNSVHSNKNENLDDIIQTWIHIFDQNRCYANEPLPDSFDVLSDSIQKLGLSEKFRDIYGC